MKRKVDILWISICPGVFALLLFIPQLLFAQEDSTRFARDSMRMNPEGRSQFSTYQLSPEETIKYSLPPSGNLNHVPEFSARETNLLPYQTNPSLLFRGDYSTSGILHQFSHSKFYGSGGQTSLPGIGRINNASLGYQQEINQKLAFDLRVNAIKMNMAYLSRQAFSASGALMYQASDRVAFKVFGSYDIGNSYGMSTHRYGATMSLDMSDRFGMEVGVQRYYDAMRGGWQTVPVVIPYYHFDKFTLGLDVGGIMYEVLREFVFDKSNRSGPTIGPPRFSLPIK